MALALFVVEPVDLIAIDGQAVLGSEVDLDPDIDGVNDLPNSDAVFVVRWDGVELVRVVAGIQGFGWVHGLLVVVSAG